MKEPKKKKKQQCNRNNCCHWQSFLSCIRQLLFKSFCASLSHLQLLALFFLSSITYIPFSRVPVSCKFIGIVKSLGTHWACLHSHLSLAQECALEINSLYMLCVSWVRSHHRAAVLCTRDFLCEAELKDALQCNPSIGHCILCINCFPHTPTPAGLHFLLIPAVACNQQNAKYYLLLAKIIHFLQFWCVFGHIAELFL